MESILDVDVYPTELELGMIDLLTQKMRYISVAGLILDKHMVKWYWALS